MKGKRRVYERYKSFLFFRFTVKFNLHVDPKKIKNKKSNKNSTTPIKIKIFSFILLTIIFSWSPFLIQKFELSAKHLYDWIREGKFYLPPPSLLFFFYYSKYFFFLLLSFFLFFFFSIDHKKYFYKFLF